MRSLSDAFKAMLASEALSLCYLFELTLKDTSVYRYTDCSESLFFSGELWRADPGINLSAVRDTSNAFNQTATISIGYAPDMLTEKIARKGGLDGSTFRLLIIDYRNKQLGSLDLFSGHIDRLTASNKYSCSVDLTGWQAKSVNVTGVYSLKCRNVFCDKGCALNIEDYSYPFTIPGDAGIPSGDGVTIGSNHTAADGIAAYGSVLWTTGRNAGEVSLVANNVAGQIALTAQPAYAPLCGEEGILRAGCDFYAETCDKTYNNLIHMQAEPTVPQGTETSAGKTTTTSVVDPAKPAQTSADTYSSTAGISYEG